MSRLDDLLFRLRAIVFRGRMERELAEEMALHRNMESEKLVAAGVSREEADREARRRFGSETRERERARDAWGTGWFQDFGADLRFALRQLRRRPAFTALAVLTLALGIGGTVALLSVVYGLLLRPLPVADGDRIVVFWDDFDWRGVEFDLARERVAAYQAIAAYTEDGTPLRVGDNTSILTNVMGSAELFDVLGARPLLGRTFAPGEDRPGAEPVVVLSYGTWQQEFGGDPAIIGKHIALGGAYTSVIGVMPPGFYFPTPLFRAWRPLTLDPASGSYASNGYLAVLGKLKPDMNAARVRQDLQMLAAALGQRFTYPEAWDKTKNPHVTPLREYLLGDVKPALLLLLAAAGLLLLMACANVAALILARTTDRAGEMAVRTALGAGRTRLARQVLTESATIALLSGALAVVLAIALFRLLVLNLPLQREFGEALGFDWTTFAGGLVTALVAACIVAVVPIRHVLRGHLAAELRRERSEGGRTHGTPRAHRALVLAEVVLAVILVTGATLLIRTVGRLEALDPGLDPRGVLAVDLVLDPQTSRGQRLQFYQEIARQVAALPGVRGSGLTNRLPIRDGGWQGPVTIETRPDLADTKRPNSLWRTASPDYFRTMGIPLRAGRLFDGGDGADAAPVTVVSESFARRMWPGEDPIGKRIRTGFEGQATWRTVVGVVAEVRMVGPAGDNPLVLYVPQTQGGFFSSASVLVVRSGVDPAALIGTLRIAVHAADPGAAIARVNTMEGVLADSIQEPLRLRFFLSLFAGMGLVLGTVGVYGVVSYSVMRRRSEFGIRVALGAAPAQVLGVVMREGLTPVVAGTVVGVVLSLGLAQVIARFLFGVEPSDPVSVSAAAGVLLLAGVTAALVPAIRASRADPVKALRAE